jgi:hypothetical protein
VTALLRFLRIGAIVLGALLVALQLVPYGRDHDNPAVTADAPWDTEEGRRLARTACYDCHSNETHWPWYSHVAPMSWLVQRDVDRGRAVLNFSEWDREQEAAGDLPDAVEDGSMPPGNYILLHPDAKLSGAEKAALIAALEALEEARDEEGRDGPVDRGGSNRGRG